MQEVTRASTYRSEFYEAYKRQAKISHEELKEYNGELNATLLCVSDPIRYLKSSCTKQSEADRALLLRRHRSLWSLRHC